jgi:hypothetical protein
MHAKNEPMLAEISHMLLFQLIAKFLIWEIKKLRQISGDMTNFR